MWEVNDRNVIKEIANFGLRISNLKDRRGQTTEDSEKTLEVGGAAVRQAQSLEVGGKTKESVVRCPL